MNSNQNNPILPTASQIETMLHKEMQSLASPNKQWGIGEVQDQSTLFNIQQNITPVVEQINPILTQQKLIEAQLNAPKVPQITPLPTLNVPTPPQPKKIKDTILTNLIQQIKSQGIIHQIPEQSIVRWYFYAHAADTGQCPKSFHLWSCMSMLAALVQDKFYFQKFKGAPILPNLYTILVGPSGLGKDTAINVALEYLRPYRDLMRTFSGRLTHASFTDFLCKSRTPLPSNVRHTGMAGEQPIDINIPHSTNAVAWVVTPELAQSVSAGSKAAELIKLMTSVYTSTGREFEEITRQWGYHIATNPCVNWLAGTTHEWLIKSVGKADVKGGFASRVVWVMEDYNLDKMAGFAEYPWNFDKVKEYIEWRLYQLALDPGGEITLSVEARFELDQWYNIWKSMAKEEAEEGNKDYLPLYMRGHDLAIKLAIILRVSSMCAEEDYAVNNPNRLKITYNEIFTACRWIEQLLLEYYPKLISATNETTKEAKDNVNIAKIVYDMTKKGTIGVPRSVFHQKMFSMGYSGKNLNTVEGLLISCKTIKMELIMGEILIFWVGDSDVWKNL